MKTIVMLGVEGGLPSGSQFKVTGPAGEDIPIKFHIGCALRPEDLNLSKPDIKERFMGPVVDMLVNSITAS